MKNIGIISFNSASISPKMEAFEDIIYVDLQAILNGEFITKLPKVEFFEKIKQSGKVPTTSQPTTGDILEGYTEALKKYNKVLVLTPEKTLSGTHQNSILARDLLNSKEDKQRIHIIQTRSFAFSESMLCDTAIDMIRDNENIEDIEKELTRLSQNISTYIIPGSFSYLKKSGRVNLAQLVIGKMMVLKLLVKHNQSEGDGFPFVYKKTRGEKRMLKTITEEINSFKSIEKIYAGDLIINDTKVLEKFKSLFDDRVVYCKQISLIMAAHFGPETYAFAIIGEKDEN